MNVENLTKEEILAALRDLEKKYPAVYEHFFVFELKENRKKTKK